MTPAGGGGAFDRLTATDLMYLRLETREWPCHFAGLIVLDGAPLLDGEGNLRSDEIARELARRLSDVPKLRSRVLWPGPLGGRPIWVEDEKFDAGHHLLSATVEPPGGEAELLTAASALHGRLLDRRRPLWELSMLTGLAGGRVGVLIKIHHSVADGMAALTVMGSLFDPGPNPTRRRGEDPYPVPTRAALIGDNLSSKARRARRALSMLSRPRRVISAAGRLARITGHAFGSAGAPGSSLNLPVRAGRRMGRIVLDLETVRETGRAHGGTVNDVVLALWAAGLRRLLASRSELVDGMELIAAVPASLRTSSGAVDNQTGTMIVRLPIGDPDPASRLDRIVEATTEAKRAQRPEAVMGYLAGLAGTPLGKWFSRRQRASNVIVTNVAGPTGPVSLLGARVLEFVPMLQLVGNVGLALCAFSYDGALSLVVTADATAFPDLDVLVEGMEGEWRNLSAQTPRFG